MTRAREYLRVSQDRTGRMESPEQQHAENAVAAKQNGWTLGEPYREANGVSASRFSAKTRDEFAKLTGDLEAGRFGADILILWEASRGSRKLSEWARLIEQCEAAGAGVYVTTHGRLYDPGNARDRRTLQEDGVDSEYESGKASLRIRRAAAALAAEGKPHGRVPYGYRREYSLGPGGKRELAAQLPEPAEAAVVAELFRRLRAGHSLKAIARDFEDRGILTRSGKLFDAQHLRDVALRPIYAGLRVHSPGGRVNRYRGSLDGAVKATWPALIDPETFHAVRSLLLSPERRTSRPGRGKHLLSLIAVCDVCGGWLSVSYRRGYREYMCRDASHIYIDADGLDGHAEQVMCAYLSRPDVIKGLRATPERGGELGQLRTELAEARAELASLRAAARDGRVSVATLIDVEPSRAARVESLEARERELVTPPALAMIPPGKDVARRWQAAPMSARRQVARMLCSPPILGQLRVKRSPSPGHPVAPADRVVWDRDTR